MQALRCHCGTLRGELDPTQAMGRAVCYCKDCQAYARFLERADELLDASGGTDILACVPRGVRFTAGADKLVCMSLGRGGLLRWYAGCCRTPIGNTPRDRGTAYVGLVRACLPGDRDDFVRAFGPLRVALNTASARKKVRATPFAMLFGVGRIAGRVLTERLTGRYRRNPFFDEKTGNSIRRPAELSQAQRAGLDR